MHLNSSTTNFLNDLQDGLFKLNISIHDKSIRYTNDIYPPPIKKPYVVNPSYTQNNKYL